MQVISTNKTTIGERLMRKSFYTVMLHTAQNKSKCLSAFGKHKMCLVSKHNHIFFYKPSTVRFRERFDFFIFFVWFIEGLQPMSRCITATFCCTSPSLFITLPWGDKLSSSVFGLLASGNQHQGVLPPSTVLVYHSWR